MKPCNLKSTTLFILILLTIFDVSYEKQTKPISQNIIINLQQVLNTAHQWRKTQATQFLDESFHLNLPFVLAGIFCFAAATISSAGGTGGGGLFIPILTIVAGLDLKLASSFSAFMVAGGSIANVVCHMFISGRKHKGKALIDYDIALLSEPCMLVGVSIGVICNVVLPEWLVTVSFAVFLAWSTFKTFKSGVKYWKLESEGIRRNGQCMKLEDGNENLEKPLLDEVENECKMDIPWMKLGVLVVIWFSFLAVYLLRGNRHGQGIIHIKTCGIGYWIISSVQIPLAIIFTMWILCSRKTPGNIVASSHQEIDGETKKHSVDGFLLCILAFSAGMLGGVFGIGGGMLISPLLLQLGLGPEVTAATCSFMVFFSASMSAVQYLSLGMEHINSALIFSLICFIASVIGLTLVQRAIMRHGRASLIVFSVGTVMALSTVLITGFGAVDVWKSYIGGESMGFKKPC